MATPAQPYPDLNAAPVSGLDAAPQIDPSWGQTAPDVSFEQAFPAEPQPAPAAVPAAPVPSGPYLGTYATREEAERGLQEKDRTIEAQRQREAYFQRVLSAYGLPDPGSLRQTVQGQQPSILDVFEASVERNDPRLIENAIGALVQQRVNQVLQPMQPLMEHANVTRALEIAATDKKYGDPNIPAWVRSDNFRQTIQNLPPVMADAIRAAERDPAYNAQLPQLYAMAYKLAAAQPQAPAAARPTPATTATPAPAFSRPPLPQGQRATNAQPMQAVPGPQTRHVEDAQNPIWDMPIGDIFGG